MTNNPPLPCPMEALDWQRDLDILKTNLENLPQEAELTAQEIAILLHRISRVKNFISAALTKAAAYDRIKPMLDELVEARKKATLGEWEIVVRNAPWDGNQEKGDREILYILNRFKQHDHLTNWNSDDDNKTAYENGAFMSKAASIANRIAQEVGDDGTR